jgi:hypothetical protein
LSLFVVTLNGESTMGSSGDLGLASAWGAAGVAASGAGAVVDADCALANDGQSPTAVHAKSTR